MIKLSSSPRGPSQNTFVKSCVTWGACEMALPLASDCTTVVEQRSAVQTV